VAAAAVVAAASSSPSSASSLAELHAYGVCLAGYTAHLTSGLLLWLTGGAAPAHCASFTGPTRRCLPPGGAARLSESLRRLFAPRTWLSGCATPLQRFLSLQLLLSAWPLLLAPCLSTSSSAAAVATSGGKGGRGGAGAGGGAASAADAAVASESATRAPTASACRWPSACATTSPSP
jgi:hypothetical protein